MPFSFMSLKIAMKNPLEPSLSSRSPLRNHFFLIQVMRVFYVGHMLINLQMMVIPSSALPFLLFSREEYPGGKILSFVANM